MVPSVPLRILKTPPWPDLATSAIRERMAVVAWREQGPFSSLCFFFNKRHILRSLKNPRTILRHDTRYDGREPCPPVNLVWDRCQSRRDTASGNCRAFSTSRSKCKYIKTGG